MKKIRRVLALFVAVAMVAASIGCSKEITAEDLMVNVETSNVSEVYLDDSFCEKYSAAAFKMLQNEYSSKSTKVVLSPLAVYYNCAMLANGATGKTKNDIQGMFGRDFMTGFLNANMHSFNENLKDSDKSKLYFENALWFNSDKNITPSQTFLSTVKTNYDIDAYRESFSKDAVKNINNWASNKTNMYSERILKEFKSDAPLYLVNTTLIEADWEAPISPADTFDGKFKSLSGEEQSVQMMSSMEKLYVMDENVVGFIKKYSGNNYAFVALIPANERDTSLDNLIPYLASDKTYFTLMKKRKDFLTIDASIPKYSCEFTGEVNQLIEKANLGELLNSEFANFDDVGTCDGKIYLGGLALSTGLNVTEGGTKRGTGANVGNAPAGVNMIPINLNRPFVFAVVDTKRFLPVIVGAINSVKD